MPALIRKTIVGLIGMVIGVLLSGCSTGREEAVTVISKWGRFEQAFRSTVEYANPIQTVDFKVKFVSPMGEERVVDGFWDGGMTWKVRFSPDMAGQWRYTTECSDNLNTGLDKKKGGFLCTAPTVETRLSRHGPVRVSRHGPFFEYADGEPFFWLSDIAWNGALKSGADDWVKYLQTRAGQGFTVCQWVATQWSGAPEGDTEGRVAFSGKDEISVYPKFFQKLDKKVELANRLGVVSAPVMLWAGKSEENPGFNLPADQAILLAKYMVARWDANHVVWILAANGDFGGGDAERWKRIGKEVFKGRDKAVVTILPRAMEWIGDDFADAEWIDFVGYRSGDGTGDDVSRWICRGAPAQGWKGMSNRPCINMGPNYEYIMSGDSRARVTASRVRRVVYWSLLNAPPAGVAYGAHGVWNWGEGIEPPRSDLDSGTYLPWEKALTLSGAGQMRHVYSIFDSIDFWRLRPEPGLIMSQPGLEYPSRFIASSGSAEGDLAVFYLPDEGKVEVSMDKVPSPPVCTWFNPRTGERLPTAAVVSEQRLEFSAPGPGDWLLVIKAKGDDAGRTTAD
ncbi:MAG: DUF4038 domain-containing protein [Verrucomicrobia bacterium]|nr:DUF4038 domain-containing protein [Verrucomicrobiota bacterium]